MTAEQLYQWAKERGLEKTALYVEDCCGTRWVSEEDLETSYVGLRLS